MTTHTHTQPPTAAGYKTYFLIPQKGIKEAATLPAEEKQEAQIKS